MKFGKAFLLALLLLCILPLGAIADVSAVYEIFTGSFYDSDGDSIGDLPGIQAKLDYIKALGADAVWLTPVSPSPSYHKYDVKAYCDIDPAFGTLADYAALAEACEARGMTLLFDLVINHTSTEHPWFISAVQSLQNGDMNNPYIAYYQFTQGTGAHSLEGTDWYYDGDFGEHMPELNLENPAVRDEIKNIIAFWLAHGVSGFRLDAVTYYYYGQPDSNRVFLGWLCETIRSLDPDAFIVGEAWADEVAILDLYQSGIDALFNFPMSSTGALSKAMQRESGQAFANRVVSWQQSIAAIHPQALAAPFLSNHDQGRIAGVLRMELQQEKQAAALYLLSPGVPFLYYGEEIGMTGSGDDENKRLPMLWSVIDSTGICAPPADASQAQRLMTGVDEQAADPESLLSFYQKVLAFRKQYPVFVHGNAAIVKTEDTRLAAFTLTDSEQTLFVAHNLSKDETLLLPAEGTLLAVFDTGSAQSIESDNGIQLAPCSTAVWMLKPEK